jgi:hypothetical protein
MPLNMSQPHEPLVHLLRQHRLDALIKGQAGALKPTPEVMHVAPEKIVLSPYANLELPGKRPLQTFEALRACTHFEPASVASPHHMVPRTVHVLEELPIDTSKRVDEKDLSKTLEQRSL